SPRVRPALPVPRALAPPLLPPAPFGRGGAQPAAPAPPAAAAHRLTQSRADLERLLAHFVAMAQSDTYEPGVSADEVRAETTYIRQRLEQGDFHVGDRVLIAVDMPAPPLTPPPGPAAKSTEQQLSDTFTVGPSQELTLPEVGVVSLRGVLRAELE